MTTPLEQQAQLAEAIGISSLYFKREDLHPYGSHKGRSIPVMIEHYLASGDTRFAISSSGNAALAAVMHGLAVEGHGAVQAVEFGQCAEDGPCRRLRPPRSVRG